MKSREEMIALIEAEKQKSSGFNLFKDKEAKSKYLNALIRELKTSKAINNWEIIDSVSDKLTRTELKHAMSYSNVKALTAELIGVSKDSNVFKVIDERNMTRYKALDTREASVKLEEARAELENLTNINSNRTAYIEEDPAVIGQIENRIKELQQTLEKGQEASNTNRYSR